MTRWDCHRHAQPRNFGHNGTSFAMPFARSDQRRGLTRAWSFPANENDVAATELVLLCMPLKSHLLTLKGIRPSKFDAPFLFALTAALEPWFRHPKEVESGEPSHLRFGGLLVSRNAWALCQSPFRGRGPSVVGS